MATRGGSTVNERVPRPVENPASNPTRKWEDTADVREHLSFLVGMVQDARTRGGKYEERARFLESLFDGRSHTMTKNVQPLIDFLNKMAESFGFVNIVESQGETYSLAPGVKEPLSKVISGGHRPGH
jgi:hypothetical protein